MKHIYISLLMIIFSCSISYGQLNVLSSNGNVTIGDLTNGADELDLYGDLRLRHDGSNDNGVLRFYNASNESLGFMTFTSPSSTGANRINTDFQIEADWGDIFIDAEEELNFNTNDVTRARFDKSGNFDFQGTHFLGWDEGTVRKAYLRYSGTHLYLENDEVNGDIYIDGEDEVRLLTNDIARVYVKNDGKVGIGISAPAERLDVNGNITIGPGFRYGFDESGVYKGGMAYNGTNMFIRNDEAGGFLSLNGTAHISLLSNNVEHMRIANNGNVGIGVTAPTEKLHVSGGIRIGNATGNANGTISYNGTDIFGRVGGAWVSLTQAGGSGGGLWSSGSGSSAYFNSGNVGIGTSSPAHALQVNGDIGMTGEILGVSDIRTKKEVRNLDNALEAINAMRPVSYTFNQAAYSNVVFPEGKQIGFIAQEVESILPSLVSMTTSGLNAEGQEDALKGINYIKLIPVLTKAIQEQTEFIETQSTMIEHHDQSIKQLQKEIEVLKALLK